MTLNTILDRLGLPTNGRNSPRGKNDKFRRQRFKHRRRRALLENLEDRRVLATYMVTSLADSGSGSLRAALQSANATGDTDTIVFDSALSGTVNLGVANGALTISSPVSIQGPGSSSVTIDANATVTDKFRVFEISGAANNVTITGLTLTGGIVDDGGGGILFRSADTLTLVDTVVTGNVAANGGGIYSEYEGNLVLQSSTISGNTAESSKGGGIHAVDGDVSLTDSTISGNFAYGGGGGIFSQYAGNINVTNSQITNNEVTEAGYHGGGIYGGNGDVTLTGSTVSGNESKGDGGGLYSYKGSVAISNTTITGNKADYGGGGVFNYEGDLTITSSVITSNNAYYGSGGGVGNEAGRLTISGSRITDNEVIGDGGGVATNTGVIDISQSLIASNTSTIDGGGIASAVGVVLVTNTTISGNSAAASGGGIQADAAIVRLVHVTLASNTASASGGGIGVVDDDTAESILVYNSIIASNSAATGIDLHIPGDPGTTLDIQSSLIGNNSGSTLAASSGDANGNVIGSAASPVDAQLSPLANNGGVTNTHDIGGSSPALNSADPALSLDFGADDSPGGGDDVTLSADQRAGLYARSVSLAPDMGALEKQSRPTLVVDTASDVVNGDLSPGDRSLRELLNLANDDLGDDVISFSLGATATISLDSSLGSLIVEENLDVFGPVTGQLIIENSSGVAFRLIDVLASTAEVNISNVTLQGGDAAAENGGAIRTAGTTNLQLDGVDLLNNTAAQGGAVFMVNGQLDIDNSRMQGNQASGNGGAVAITNGPVTIVDSTVLSNTAGGSGGAVSLDDGQLEIRFSTLQGNQATSDGGGIATTGGQVNLVNVLVAGNTSSGNGGGISAASSTSSVSTLNTTISGNTAGASGGGIYGQNASVDLRVSTLTLNDANSGGGIGVLADSNGEDITLVNSIVAANTADSAPDFVAPGTPATSLNVSYSLIGDNSGTSLSESSLNAGDPVPDGNGNLIGGGLHPVIDPQLAALADNGGPSMTHALLVTSPAVDAGDRTLLPQDQYDVDADGNVVEFLPADQRRGPAARVVNNKLDMGAYELPPAVQIEWSTPAPIVYGTALSNSQLNASANDGEVPNPGPVFGSFVYTPAVGAVLQAGEDQTLSTTFIPNELREFRVTEATVLIDVMKADPVLTWSDPADIVYLTPLSSTQLDATEQNGLAGSFEYTPASGTILQAGSDQQLSVTFTPTDSVNYNTASANVLIDVLKATPSISWSNPADISYGTLLSGTQLNATVDGNLPGTFTYDPVAGTLLDVGENQPLNVLFTPTDTANYNDVGASVDIDVVKADPELSWPDPDDIVYGTPLSGTQLNATVSGGVTGNFVYTPGSGDILDAGPDQLLTVDFTPTGVDATRYNAATTTAEINVVKADPSITWNDPAAIPHGTVLSATQLNATADVAGSFTYTPDAGTALGVGNGQALNVTFSPDDAGNFNTAVASVTIDVLPNQAPSFSASDPPTIDEDDGAQTITGFVSSFDAGTGESALQSVLAYHVSNVSYPGMFATTPSVSNAGELTYEIASDVFGEVTFDLSVQDDGGTEGGGIDMSGTQNFTITIEPVNDAPSFSLGGPVEVLEDSGAQTVVGFASDFAPGQYEDGTWPGSQQMHDEGADGTSDPLSTDNLVPTFLGATQPGSNLVTGYVEEALSLGDVDVFTFTVEAGFQWSGLYVDAYDYPNGAMGDNAAFLAIDEGTSFPYNADDFQNNPFIDYNAFLGGTVFGTSDLGGGDILQRAGSVTGSRFSGPLAAGTYTIYIQQTGPATTYTLDFEVTSVARQSVSSYEVSSVSIPSLFSAGPAIDANGDLTFTPAADTFGTSTFQVRVIDDGGTTNGGTDASGFLTGTITVDEVVLDRDYGDAPAGYAVLAAENGASHVVGSLILGAAVDIEADGQPSANADGDGSDDDGVVELASVIAIPDAATNSSFLVTASETGRVDAWIDFNENGVWTDAGEQIATDLLVSGGENTLTYVVPGGTSAGDKVVRFRLSSAGGLPPTGDAPDGEVEDMLLSVVDGSTPKSIITQMNSATTTVEINAGVMTVSDGANDLFAAPLTSVQDLTLNGRTGDDVVTLSFETGPDNGMNLDGDGGDNSLIVSAALVDLTTDGDLVAVNFQSIDASAAAVSQILLDAPTVAALSPANKTVRVTGGVDDVVTLTDSENWSMTDPVIDGGRFYRVAVNQLTAEQIQLDDDSSAWQNLVTTTDVDASGDVTVFDALLVIDEAGANVYSDENTALLDDPLSVGDWPDLYFDVNRDGNLTPLDALIVLNALAIVGDAEGEAVSILDGYPDPDLAAPLQSLLARQDRGFDVRGNALRTLQSDIVLAGEFCLTSDLTQSGHFTQVNEPHSLEDKNALTAEDLSGDAQSWADSIDQLLAGNFSISDHPV